MDINVIFTIGIVLVIIGFFILYHFKHKVSGTPELPFKVLFIDDVKSARFIIGIFGFKLYTTNLELRSGEIRKNIHLLSKKKIDKGDYVKYVKLRSNFYYVPI